MKKVRVEKRYAIAVRDGVHLFLFMCVKWTERLNAGEFFAFLPRPHDTSINAAHASYHADGGYHVKKAGKGSGLALQHLGVVSDLPTFSYRRMKLSRASPTRTLRPPEHNISSFAR